MAENYPVGQAPASETREVGELVEGRVEKILPNGTYLLHLSPERDVIGHMAPNTERNFVRLRVGDRVLVKILEKDPLRARIVKQIR